MERRQFIQACVATVAASSAPSLASDAKPRFYTRSRLVDERGRPMRAKGVPAGRNLIFHYPFTATPCFLLNLGRPVQGSAALKTADGRSYEWKGGVGSGRSIVAYSAICAHKLTYPTREISFISFRADKSPRNRHANVIHCCSEHSQYDPAEGGRVVAGPAPQPLAAILVEHDPADDGLHAVGTLGGEMFAEFFSRFEMKLSLEHGGAARQATGATCVVQELEAFCKQQVKC